MSDVPMYPQPPSNEDGPFGRSEPDFDPQFQDESGMVDENSWLLDDGAAAEEGAEPVPTYEAVHSLPGEFNERLDTVEAYSQDGEGFIDGEGSAYDPDNPEGALDAFADGLTKTDPMLGASFVEPEPAGRAVSRALVPAGIALLVSFSGIAVWAFVKKPASSINPVDIEVAAPDVVDTLEGKRDDVVTLPGSADGNSGGRISFQRDGSTKVVGQKDIRKDISSTATVRNPREPGELSGSGNGKRPSFSSFGDSKEAVIPRETPEVEEAPDDMELDSFVSAEEFNASLDQGLVDEAIETFDSLEDDVFLPQEFMDSFVLSIDPIEDVASIYGDINTRNEVDSFADLDTSLSTPFDSQGFGSFGVSQWEGMGAASNLADAELPAEQEYDVFLPFGMFQDESDEDLVASVDVGAEDSVTVVPAEPTQETAEEVSDVVADADAEGAVAAGAEEVTASEDPLLALFGLPEGQEIVTEEPEVVAETAVETVEAPMEDVVETAPEDLFAEVSVELLVEDPAEGLSEDATDEAAETPADELLAEAVETVEESVSEVVEVAAAESSAAESSAAESSAAELDTELKSELDIASAHARLDSLFGMPAVEPVVAEVDETTESPDTTEAIDAEEPVLLAEVSEDDEPALEVPAEVIAALEGPVGPEVEEAPEVEPEPETVAEVTVEPTEEPIAEPTEEPVAPEEPAAIEQPEPVQVAVASPDPAAVEVLESVVDPASANRYGSALKRTGTDNIWSNRTVPKSKVGGDQFVLTPNVGNVRVIFDGGESIDGRLHGVGAQKVVLDTKLGRMTLDARRADRIDRLGGGKRAELRSPSDSYASTKGLDRVKVRAAGGVFYGYLVAQANDKVTLMLDDGVRVTLNSTEIETAKARKASSRLRRR